MGGYDDADDDELLTQDQRNNIYINYLEIIFIWKSH